jgi:ABC-2 type transport system permease protein
MASVSVPVHPPSLATSTVVIAKRSLLKFLRTPQLLWTASIQGVMFLIIFRYIFGGAIGAGGLGYVDFVVPGILTTMLIWQGMGAAIAITEDRAQGLHDRLRSLPIPRAAVLSGRAFADTTILLWSLAIMTIVSFLVGFRLHDGIPNGLIALGLIIVFSFAFEWVFITVGLALRGERAGGARHRVPPRAVHVRLERVRASVFDARLARDRCVASARHVHDRRRPGAHGRNRSRSAPWPSASYFVVRSLAWSGGHRRCVLDDGHRSIPPRRVRSMPSTAALNEWRHRDVSMVHTSGRTDHHSRDRLIHWARFYDLGAGLKSGRQPLVQQQPSSEEDQGWGHHDKAIAE